MLEEFALEYVSQSEGFLRLIVYGVTIAGAVIAALFHKNQTELRRAPYFAYLGLLFFVSAAFQLVWLGSVPAIIGHYLWVFMAIDIIVGLAVGYGYGVITMARSRDAYGHAWMAPLAFIPIASLWLLLTPSKNEVSTNRVRTIPLLTDGLGVLIGFIFRGLGIAVLTFIMFKGDRIAVEAQNDPMMQQAGIDMLLRTQGLEQMLMTIAAEVPPHRVDEVTTLVRATSDNAVLRYQYEVTSGIEVLPIFTRVGIAQDNCTNEAIRPLIEAGATIEHVYLAPDRREIGKVEVTPALCGY